MGFRMQTLVYEDKLRLNFRSKQLISERLILHTLTALDKGLKPLAHPQSAKGFSS
jgi:hypothetical protein